MTKKLSILYVTYEYPNLNGSGGGGGIANVYFDLTRRLAELGHDIWVITHANDKEQKYEQNGVNVWRIPSDPTKSDTLVRVKSRSEAVDKAIRSLLKKKQFDIIQFPEFNGEGSFFLKSGRAFKKHSRPVIIIRLHSSTKPYKKMNKILTKDEGCILKLEEEALNLCDAVISPCEATWTAVKRTMNINRKLFYVIPNSIDTQLFVPVSRPPDEQPFVFGFIGKLSHPKGVDTIVDAFASLVRENPDKKFQLVLIGRDKLRHHQYGSFDRWLAEHIPKSVQQRITVKRYISRYKLVNEYQQFHTFLFASRYENFPNTLMEAMSCGLPVIASQVGGVPELLGKDHLNLTFEAGNTDELSQAMHRMMSDSKLRQKAGAFNRQRIEMQFSTEYITRHCLEVYKRLMKSFKREE
jgi:glycosyltransferase involved in cell wall biosynthesis